MSTYIHQTESRLRVRSDYILDNAEQVRSLIAELEKIPAITDIRHRKFAGSVTIRFNHKEVEAESLLEMLESHGWLRSRQRSDFVGNAVRNGSRTLLKGITVMAVKQIVGGNLLRTITA
ncbi:HMA2 domain-containing protein [Endozoicomonadaceae bacterium StTr2]